MAKEVKVSIGADGKVSMDAVGFTGNSCEAATKQLQQFLSATPESDTKKPEYYQPGGQVSEANKLRF